MGYDVSVHAVVTRLVFCDEVSRDLAGTHEEPSPDLHARLGCLVVQILTASSTAPPIPPRLGRVGAWMTKRIELAPGLLCKVQGLIGQTPVVC